MDVGRLPCLHDVLKRQTAPAQEEGAEKDAKVAAQEAETEDDEADDDDDLPGEEEPEEAVEHVDDAALLRVTTAAETEQFDAEMKERLRANVDRFEEMVEHEEGIRLGEVGWKERYYKVGGGAHIPLQD